MRLRNAGDVCPICQLEGATGKISRLRPSLVGCLASRTGAYGLPVRPERLHNMSATEVQLQHEERPVSEW